jgi:hypothetical protein
MKKQNLMAAVAMAATVAMFGVVSSANAANDIRNTVFGPGSTPAIGYGDNTSTGPTRPTLDPESATEIVLRKRSEYLASVVQIIIRQRNEWFAKATNLVRRPQ